MLERLRRHDERGMTLLELLIAMVVVAILSGSATSVFLHQRRKGWMAQVIAATKNLASAQEYRINTTGATGYAVDVADLVSAGFTFSADDVDPLVLATGPEAFCLEVSSRHDASIVWHYSSHVGRPEAGPATPACVAGLVIAGGPGTGGAETPPVIGTIPTEGASGGIGSIVGDGDDGSGEDTGSSGDGSDEDGDGSGSSGDDSDGGDSDGSDGGGSDGDGSSDSSDDGDGSGGDGSGGDGSGGDGSGGDGSGSSGDGSGGDSGDACTDTTSDGKEKTNTRDPDGDENGGEDRPEGTGGVDCEKDNNNGSGNDTDGEDDNNGTGE